MPTTSVLLPDSLTFSGDSILVDHHDQNFLVCCFYTPNYQQHAQQLKQSLDNLNINHYLQSVPDQGYWEANTRIKPYFLQHCLTRFANKNILYLDADAVVKRPLDYFENIDTDIAVYETHRAKGMSHDYLTGTIFLRQTPATHDLVEKWCMAQQPEKKTQVDQDSFDSAMQQMKAQLSIEPLPLGYIKIFDKDYSGTVYIEQYQASRGQTKLRRQRIRRRNQILAGVVIILIIITALKIF
ncbi:putative nucleotide-diphospho-sugar transferase [Psychrobacter sp. I-STPA6b]|uniref:putative nucleotide-diphospho-sugar transferase n=1 Tax=Psychrobacter sp. I-STPA6b TaxID=2585718 RepID=UPI001D0C15B4|nr:putative nucleotide-diphospho-sugar transferase [Psychrobacter sp. I-STPA6b]